jgi:hypothetical protein
VVVVVDRGADVVHHRGRPQEVALARVAGVGPGLAERVPHPEREPRDVLDVGEVGVVLRGEVEDRVAAHVLEQRRVATLEQRRVEDALAQARLGDLERVEGADVHHGLDHERAGEDQVTALGFDARDLAALFGAHVGELLDELVERLALEQEALHPERRLAGRDLRRGREVAHSPADAGEARAVLARVVEPSRCAQLVGDVRAQRLELLLLDGLAGEEALCHADRAERPRAGVARGAVLDGGQLQRAAAEVERDAVRERRRVDRREIAVAGLLLGREHLDLEPRALARLAQEVLAVGGVADRRGGDRANVGDLGGTAEVGEQLDRLEGALHRRGLQLAGGVEAGADTHRLVDLVRPAPPAVAAALAPGEDDQAERVRPKVDDGQAPVAHSGQDRS